LKLYAQKGIVNVLKGRRDASWRVLVSAEVEGCGDECLLSTQVPRHLLLAQSCTPCVDPHEGRVLEAHEDAIDARKAPLLDRQEAPGYEVLARELHLSVDPVPWALGQGASRNVG